MKKKTTVLFTLLLLSLLLTASTLFAPAATVRVMDMADLLTSAEEQALMAKLDTLGQTHARDIVIFTVHSTGGRDMQAYADDLYRQNGYGYSNGAPGILLVISITTREYAMTTDAADIFDSAAFDDLEDAMLPHLKADDFYGAFVAFADECDRHIAGAGRLSPAWIVVSLLVGAGVAGLVLWLMISKHKNVKMQISANTYMLRDTFRLNRSRDVYLYSHTTRIARPKNSSSGGGRSGGSGRSVGRSGRF